MRHKIFTTSKGKFHERGCIKQQFTSAACCAHMHFCSMKQHYVPNCYLKAWCDPQTPKGREPYVWMFPKEGGQGKRKAPSNIFSEPEIYTLYTDDGKPDRSIETSFSSLEGEFTKIRRLRLNKKKPLDVQDEILLRLFIAAMHARTKAMISHIKNIWKEPLEMMDEIDEKLRDATPEERLQMAHATQPITGNQDDSFSREDLQEMFDNPVGTLMIPQIQIEMDSYTRMGLAIMNTSGNERFITSDNPVVWFDPEACKRPWPYNVAALGYKTVEIYFPISPTQCAMLTRSNLNGYHELSDTGVTEVNRFVRFRTSEHFINHENATRDNWFDHGIEPEDSWRKRQARGEFDD